MLDEGPFLLEPWTKSEYFCSFFKVSSYVGIFHCSTCAIDRLRSRPRSNGSHFVWLRQREEVLISFPACFTAIDLWIQLKKRTPQTKIEWLGRRSPPAYLIHQKATWPAYWFFLRGSTKIWKKGTRVPNWNHGKSLLCKYTKSSHSSKRLLPSLIWVVLFGIWFYLPFL